MPIRLWQGLNSWYTEQPRPAPHSSFPLISLEPGALRSGEGPQFYKLPKPAGSLHSKNGEKGFHLFLRGARSRFVWEEWSRGEGFELHLEFIGLCFLLEASPPWKGFGFDLLRFIFSNQLKKKTQVLII